MSPLWNVLWLAVSTVLCYLPIVCGQTCMSFGVDFQDGGTYFQNSLSNNDFSFVSEYKYCNNDTASNILVAPDGDEWLCSNTPLQPDDTPELSTCPIVKAELYSGEWSILTISNNGNGDPIAYERDFSLIVGPQQTLIIIPTVTFSVTSTQTSSFTSISIFTATIVASPIIVTSPATVLHPSTTITPKTTTVTSTKTLGTLTLLTNTLTVSQIVRTATASCALPSIPRHLDFRATITPTNVAAAALQSPVARHRGRSQAEKETLRRRPKSVSMRKEYLKAAAKRAPDEPTITVTDLNTSDYVTSTTTLTAAPTTITVVSISTSTTVSTPPAVTVFQGTSTASTVTVMAPTPSKTLTEFTIDTTHLTITLTQVAIVTTTTTPAAVAASCTLAGGTV